MPPAKMPIRRSNSGPNQVDVAPRLGPPKRGKKEIKLTAMQLYKMTWKSRIDSSRRIAVRSIKKRIIKSSTVLPADAPCYQFQMYSKDQKHDHKVTIFMPEGLPFSPKSHVITDCNCSDAMFRFEYVMAKKYGTAFIWRCNGEAPIVTNPGMRAGVCKHTYLALNYLFRKYKSGGLKSVDNKKTPNIRNLNTAKK